MTNDSGKSDKPIVPGKDANKRRGGPRQAERLEERGLAKGNLEGRTGIGHRTKVTGNTGPNRCAQRTWSYSMAVTRLYPRQEPGAVVPHAGICAGGGPKGPSLPRRSAGISRQEVEGASPLQ